MICSYKYYFTFLLTLIVITSCGGGSSGPDIVYLPPIYSDDYSDIKALEGNKEIIIINAIDSNNRRVSYSITGGDDEELFSLAADGKLTFLKTPDYESPHDTGLNNIYKIDIEASAGLDITPQSILIKVEDAIEGRVVDGPLVGARVFIDNNDNSILDSDEKSAITNSEGFFYINKKSVDCIGACGKKLIAHGGIDKQTNRKSNLLLKAPLDVGKVVQITPLSTLIDASDDESLLLANLELGIETNELLTLDVWSAAKEGQELSQRLMRLNLQLGMILTATYDLISPGSTMTRSEISSLYIKKLAQALSTKKKSILSKDIINNFLTSLVTEIASDLNFDSTFIESLAKSIETINILLEEKSLNPTNRTSAEILILSQYSIKNTIEGALLGALDLEQFSERISIEKIFKTSALMRSLLDTDEDGFADAIDANDDNDALSDLVDAFPLDKNETLDTDADGTGNNADTDDDGDGVVDGSDAYPLNANVHTAPTATNAGYNLPLLPKTTNTGSQTLASTSQGSRAVTYAIVANGTSGTATITNTSTGVFTYSTTQTAVTADYFTFKVNDGYVDSTTGKIDINLKTDPLYKYQWHLDNTGQKSFATNAGTSGADMNVDGAIAAGKTGVGIIVAVVDSGLEIAHEDIVDNVVTNGSYNFANSTNDPSPTGTAQDHGTMVTGIIAAKGWNNKGVRGVAPNASIKAFNMILNGDTGTIANEVLALGAMSLASDVSVFNMSYGGYDAAYYSDETALTYVRSELEDQMIAGTSNLRNSKGASYVIASGNDYYKVDQSQDVSDPPNIFTFCGTGANAGTFKIGCWDAIFDNVWVMPYFIGVGALNAENIKSTYSTPGASLWISAPGGEFGSNADVISCALCSHKPAITTIDRSSCTKGANSSDSVYNISNAFNDYRTPHSENLNCNYTNVMNGTSSAAPNVSGVIALMLETNPALTWRDVKHILATTAVQVDSSFSASKINDIDYVGWITNSTGLKFHSWYGFGAVDATAAVNAAAAYTTGSLGNSNNTSWNNSSSSSVTIPDATLVTQTLTESGAGTVEHVLLATKITHSDPTHLGFRLESPSGTIMTLLPPLTALGTDFSSSQWIYLPANAFYGETKAGDWKLHIFDHISGSTGTRVQWGIKFMYR